MFVSIIVFILLSCSEEPKISLHESTSHTNTITKTQEIIKNQDNGTKKHPPIPANNPIWEWDAKTFVPDFGWFGEHSWMDVRMRVVGHLSAAGRDLVRYYVQQGDFQQAQIEAEQMISILQNIPKAQQGFSTDIHNILIEGFRRDTQWIEMIAQQDPDTAPIAQTPFAKLREEYYRLALIHEKDTTKDISQQAKNLQQKLRNHLEKRTDLDLLGFENFVDRHKLRVRLFDAYIDALDPLIVQERWGYWEATEIQRQALLLGWALELLGGDSWQEYIDRHSTKTTTLSPAMKHEIIVASPVLWPSLLGNSIQSPDQIPQESPEEFGRLPTGDSLIDIAGHPGPKGIGTLEKLGMDDNEHKTWLLQQSQMIVQNLANPSKVLKICETATQKLNSYDHGSRFYNVKQFRNACVRQLALSHSYQEAYTLLQQNFPLHNQDWACPNRQGILEAIGGRLLVLSNNPDAVEKLEDSIQTSLDFLQNVDLAEEGKLQKPKPPSMGGMGMVPGSVPKHLPNTNPPHRTALPGQAPHFQNSNSKANSSPQ